MSRYWCAESADGRTIAEGLSGEWPLKPEMVAKVAVKGDAPGVAAQRLADRVYVVLRKIRPEGGEISWAVVPENIKEVSAFPETPAKLCVSF